MQHAPTTAHHDTPRSHQPRSMARALCASGLLAGASLLSGLAFAADTAAPAAATAKATSQTIQAQYTKDRAACMSGKTNQDQATCLREAGAARDEAMKGVLNNDGADTATMQRNALERCKQQPAADQAACRDRIGQGVTSGSVQGGGILRELTQVEPATKPAVQAPEPAPTK